MAGGLDAAGPWWKGLSILSCHKLVSGVQEKSNHLATVNGNGQGSLGYRWTRRVAHVTRPGECDGSPDVPRPVAISPRYFFFYSRSTNKLKSISRGLQLPGECLELDPQWPRWAGDWLLAVLPFPILSLARAHRVAKVSRIA